MTKAESAASRTPRTDAKERETENYWDFNGARLHAHYGWKLARALELEAADLRERLAKAREEAIEECAKVADRVWQESNALRDSKLAGEIARSIRALTQKGQS